MFKLRNLTGLVKSGAKTTSDPSPELHRNTVSVHTTCPSPSMLSPGKPAFAAASVSNEHDRGAFVFRVPFRSHCSLAGKLIYSLLCPRHLQEMVCLLYRWSLGRWKGLENGGNVPLGQARARLWFLSPSFKISHSATHCRSLHTAE